MNIKTKFKKGEKIFCIINNRIINTKITDILITKNNKLNLDFKLELDNEKQTHIIYGIDYGGERILEENLFKTKEDLDYYLLNDCLKEEIQSENTINFKFDLDEEIYTLRNNKIKKLIVRGITYGNYEKSYINKEYIFINEESENKYSEKQLYKVIKEQKYTTYRISEDRLFTSKEDLINNIQIES